MFRYCRGLQRNREGRDSFLRDSNFATMPLSSSSGTRSGDRHSPLCGFYTREKTLSTLSRAWQVVDRKILFGTEGFSKLSQNYLYPLDHGGPRRALCCSIGTVQRRSPAKHPVRLSSGNACPKRNTPRAVSRRGAYWVAIRNIGVLVPRMRRFANSTIGTPTREFAVRRADVSCAIGSSL